LFHRAGPVKPCCAGTLSALFHRAGPVKPVYDGDCGTPDEIQHSWTDKQYFMG